MNILNFCQKVALFKNLSTTQLEHIVQLLTVKRIAKNQAIFTEGQHAICCYIIYSGKVKIFKLSRQGKEQTLHIMQATDVVAEAPMFAGENYPASCTATEDTIVLSLSRENLVQIIKREPQIALNLLAVQAQRLREFTLQLESFTTMDTTQRLTKYLQAKQNSDGIVKLDLSLTALANLLSVSRENLSRTISKMAQAGEIKYSKKQIVLL